MRSRYALVLLAPLALAAWAAAHRAPPPGPEPSGYRAVPGELAVKEARKLIGVFYDPLQGAFGNVGGRLGFIVCMDVPVLAYRNAGFSIRRLLEDDFAVHPDRYPADGGRPGDPYFHRRARNLYAFARGERRLRSEGPEPGDVVFYSRTPTGPIAHITLVTKVGSGGRYDVVEASRDRFYLTRETAGEDVLRRGWSARGFGRLGDGAPATAP